MPHWIHESCVRLDLTNKLAFQEDFNDTDYQYIMIAYMYLAVQIASVKQRYVNTTDPFIGYIK